LAALDQRPERADQVHPLDLLGVAARRREQQQRLAVRPPAGERDHAPEALGAPPPDRLHAPPRASARRAAIRPQNSSVNRSTSCAGNSAATFCRTASRAAGVAKNSCATSS